MKAFRVSLFSLLACAVLDAAPESRPEYVHNGVAIHSARAEYDPGAPPDPDLPRKVRLTPREVINIADGFMRDALGPDFPLHVASVGLRDMRPNVDVPERRAWLWSVRYLEVQKGATDEDSIILGNALRVYLTADGRVLMRKEKAPPAEPVPSSAPASVVPSPSSAARAHPPPASASASVSAAYHAEPHILHVRGGIAIHEDVEGYDPGPFDHAFLRKSTTAVPDVVKAADNFLRRTYGDDFSLPLSGVAVHSTQLPGEGCRHGCGTWAIAFPKNIRRKVRTRRRASPFPLFWLLTCGC